MQDKITPESVATGKREMERKMGRYTSMFGQEWAKAPEE